MPVYVYRNLKTDETFEVEQRITEDAYKTHPETGDPVRRLIQPVGIAFKGSGFYVNDSRSSKSTSKSVSADSSDSSSAATKSDTKATKSDSDAKPAKTETKKKTSKKVES